MVSQCLLQPKLLFCNRYGNLLGKGKRNVVLKAWDQRIGPKVTNLQEDCLYLVLFLFYSDRTGTIFLIGQVFILLPTLHEIHSHIFKNGSLLESHNPKEIDTKILIGAHLLTSRLKYGSCYWMTLAPQSCPKGSDWSLFTSQSRDKRIITHYRNPEKHLIWACNIIFT